MDCRCQSMTVVAGKEDIKKCDNKYTFNKLCAQNSADKAQTGSYLQNWCEADETQDLTLHVLGALTIFLMNHVCSCDSDCSLHGSMLQWQLTHLNKCLTSKIYN